VKHQWKGVTIVAGPWSHGDAGQPRRDSPGGRHGARQQLFSYLINHFVADPGVACNMTLKRKNRSCNAPVLRQSMSFK